MHFRPRSTLVQITQFLTQPEPIPGGLSKYLCRSTSFKSPLQISFADLFQYRYSCRYAFLIHPHRTNLTYLTYYRSTSRFYLYLYLPRKFTWPKLCSFILAVITVHLCVQFVCIADCEKYQWSSKVKPCSSRPALLHLMLTVAVHWKSMLGFHQVSRHNRCLTACIHVCDKIMHNTTHAEKLLSLSTVCINFEDWWQRCSRADCHYYNSLMCRFKNKNCGSNCLKRQHVVNLCCQFLLKHRATMVFDTKSHMQMQSIILWQLSLL